MSKQIVYFPKHIFVDLFSKLYSRHLVAMNEPSLWELSNNDHLHIYRFVWLRTFDPPISVRLEIDPDGAGLLVAKSTDGMGGYYPGKLVMNESVILSVEQVDRFTGKLSDIRFWQLPSRDDNLGLDGAHWIMEGVKGGEYHLVDRWSPKEGALRKTALLLIDLAGIDVEKIY